MFMNITRTRWTRVRDVRPDVLPGYELSLRNRAAADREQ